MIDIHNRKLNTVYRAMIVEFYRYKRIQATRQTQYNTDDSKLYSLPGKLCRLDNVIR